MRSGYIVQLLGEFHGGFAGLEARLTEIGLRPFHGSQCPFDGHALVRIVALPERTPLAQLEPYVCGLRGRGEATIALLPSANRGLVAMAAAINCDDVLIFPDEIDDLERRIGNLSCLASRRIEWVVRNKIMTALMPDRLNQRYWPRAKRLDVMIVGPLGSSGGRIGELLQPAQIVFAQSSRAAKRHLETHEFDIVIADLQMADDDWQDIKWPAQTQRAWVADPMQDELRQRRICVPRDWYDEIFLADQPSDLLRLRLRIMRRLATIGRELAKPIESLLPPAVLDNETGCWNASFSRAYLAAKLEDRLQSFQIIDLAPPDIGELVQEIGFAGLSRWLPQVAASLKQQLRCEDLICHLGEGQFRLVLQECAAEARENLVSRLSKTGDGRLHEKRPGHYRRSHDLVPLNAR